MGMSFLQGDIMSCEKKKNCSSQEEEKFSDSDFPFHLPFENGDDYRGADIAAKLFDFLGLKTDVLYCPETDSFFVIFLGEQD